MPNKKELSTIVKKGGLPKNKKDSAGAQYVPRRSSRVVDTALAFSDGDVWQERLAVCECSKSRSGGGRDKLTIRSYFYNSRTQCKVWDEPPTGASTVVRASANMRKMANVQLNDTHRALDLDLLPPDIQDQQQQETLQAVTESKSAPKKTRLEKLFRKNKPKTKLQNVEADAINLNLQRVIARSMLENNKAEHLVNYGPGSHNTSNKTSSSVMLQSEAEALDMAKALSLSEYHCSQPATAAITEEDNKTDDSRLEQPPATAAINDSAKKASEEEELFQRVLEVSRREALLEGVSATTPPSSFSNIATTATSIGTIHTTDATRGGRYLKQLE